jgi:hypothetical protein
VTTVEFLSRVGLNTLQDLPDREAFEKTGIVSSTGTQRRDLDEIFGSREAPDDQETFEEAEL